MQVFRAFLLSFSIVELFSLPTTEILKIKIKYIKSSSSLCPCLPFNLEGWLCCKQRAVLFFLPVRVVGLSMLCELRQAALETSAANRFPPLKNLINQIVSFNAAIGAHVVCRMVEFVLASRGFHCFLCAFLFFFRQLQSFKSCTCSHSLLFRQKYFISPVNFPFCFCFPPFVCFHSQVVFQWFALISSRPPFPFKHNVIPYRPEGSRLLSPTLLALNF